MIEKLDIRSVIEPYLKLRKAGKYYKASCPFHSEKHPSFIVDPVRQRYHCFGCGADGDSIQFIMQYQGVSFKDALSYLGINGIPYRPDPKEIKKRQLLQHFRQWCDDDYDDLCSLYRTLQKAKEKAKTIEEVEALTEFYHKESLWLYQIEVFQDNDDEKKLELFKEAVYGS